MDEVVDQQDIESTTTGQSDRASRIELIMFGPWRGAAELDFKRAVGGDLVGAFQRYDGRAFTGRVGSDKADLNVLQRA